MANLAELRDKHAETVKQIEDFRADVESKSADQLPADWVAQMDAMIESLDGVETQIKAEVEAIEKKESLAKRLGETKELQTKSAGLLPGMGGGVVNNDSVVEVDGRELKSIGGHGSIMVQHQDMVGIQVKGGFLPFVSRDEWEKPGNARLRASSTVQYKTAYVNMLRGREIETKVLTEGTDEDGGYLVPPDMVAQVVQQLPGFTVVEGRSRSITTTRDQVEIPRIAGGSTDTTMYSSAVRFEMVGETPTDSQGATEPQFEMIRLPVFTAKMTTQLSRNLVADSGFDVQGYLTDEFGRSSALGKDDKYLTGVGTYEPIGIMNDADITTVATGTSGAMTGDGWVNLIFDLPAQYQPGAIVAMSRDARKKTALLKDGNNAYLFDFGDNTGRIGEGRPATILGVPYVVSDFLDSVSGSAKVAFYGNLQFYWTVTRLQMAIQVLREKYAENNELGYLAFLRFTGGVTVPQAFRIHTVTA